MTEHQWLCMKLAEYFGLDFPLVFRAKALRSAVSEARALMTIEEVLARLTEGGYLGSARNPYGVLIARARWLVEDARLRAQVADEMAEARRWQSIDRAVHWGETLRDLVHRGLMPMDEAEERLAAEVTDEKLRAFALDALRGGPS